MGIPYYVASLVKKHRHIQKDVDRVHSDVLGIDFNCFIHRYLDPANPVGSILAALRNFLTNVATARKVYIAFDGLVPYAKMVQQRYRRFRRGEEGALFDKHQISPGTPFMKELESAIRRECPDVLMSGTDEPGEGEHKIFQWIRAMPADERRNIVIYGLDADLVLISIAQSGLGAIRLLREKGKDPAEGQEEFSTICIDSLIAALPMDADTFVRMSVLCFGNDFMPNFALFSLREEGYARAVHYTTHGGLKECVRDELRILGKRAKESDRRIVSVDGHQIETRMAVHLMDGVLDWAPVVYAFKKTYEWTLHYFKTSEVLDWTWYYPYPEAPLFQTYDSYPVTTPFVWENPVPCYTVEDQLKFILPSRSLKDAGYEAIRPDELYDELTETRHPWMKRFAWECDPYISAPLGRLTSVSEFRLP